MYREIKANVIRKMLSVESGYSVDALITYGTHPKQSTEGSFDKLIRKLFPGSKLETSFTGFFQDITSYKIKNKRLWFCVTYGGAMTSEIVHISALLGAQKVLHGGSCGALNETLQIGDFLVPKSSNANESCTRMYQRDGNTTHRSDTELSQSVFDTLDATASRGDIVSIQAMLAETKEDVEKWSQAKYQAVDIETATVFAVATHFSIPAAALLYVSDNLITGNLVHSTNEEQQAVKINAKHRILKTLLKAASA